MRILLTITAVAFFGAFCLEALDNQPLRDEVKRLRLEIVEYQKAITRLNLLLTEAQRVNIVSSAGPTANSDDEAAFVSPGVSGADSDSLLACDGCKLAPDEPRLTPVFPRSEQFIGTERER